MNDLTTVNGISGRTAGPDGIDPLVREAAADGPATQLCRAAFNAILNGEQPAVSELANATGVSSQDVELLVGRALIINESGLVVAAHGLSAVPARQHRLTLHGRPFWTWCAIDALGIPAGLGEDAVAETTCQRCGTPVRVEFKAGKVVAASHPEARVWDAQRLEGRGTVGPPHRALMNLFCSPYRQPETTRGRSLRRCGLRSKDSRYNWLEATPAIWAGEFDAMTATARYRAYLPAGSRDDEL